MEIKIIVNGKEKVFIDFFDAYRYLIACAMFLDVYTDWASQLERMGNNCIIEAMDDLQEELECTNFPPEDCSKEIHTVFDRFGIDW